MIMPATDIIERITTENVQHMGELIAIKAIKTIMAHSGTKLDDLYIGLIRDINRPDDIGYIFSDGYDIAQTAICFLCEYIGKTLGDKYGTDKHGNIITIKHACYSKVDRYIRHIRSNIYETVSITKLSIYEPSVTFESDKEDNYTAVDKKIKKMKLTEGEKETLNCYMGGMKFVEIARFLSVNLSTVWHRKLQIQKKYNKIT